MAAPRLATTRPAALTGSIGRGGFNRVHDVALVQALLGAKRDKRTRPCFRNHVTGRYDPATEEALLRYRMDQRDAENGSVRFISAILCIARPSAGGLGNA